MQCFEVWGENKRFITFLYMYLQNNKCDVISKIIAVTLWKSSSMSTVLTTVFTEKFFEVDVITSLLIGDIVKTRKINSFL